MIKYRPNVNQFCRRFQQDYKFAIYIYIICYLPIPVVDHIYIEKSVIIELIVHRNMELWNYMYIYIYIYIYTYIYICYLPIPVVDHIYIEKSVIIELIVYRNMELYVYTYIYNMLFAYTSC